MQKAVFRAHNPEVVGSSPASATIKTPDFDKKSGVFLIFQAILSTPPAGWEVVSGLVLFLPFLITEKSELFEILILPCPHICPDFDVKSINGPSISSQFDFVPVRFRPSSISSQFDFVPVRFRPSLSNQRIHHQARQSPVKEDRSRCCSFPFPGHRTI